MGKSLYLAECVKVAIFRQKHDLGSERGGSSALAGDTEFFFEIVADIRNGAYGKRIVHSMIIIARFGRACQVKKY